MQWKKHGFGVLAFELRGPPFTSYVGDKVAHLRRLFADLSI